MFSLVSRAQSVANNALTAAMVASVAIALISAFQLYTSGAWQISETAIANVRASASIKNSFAFGAVGGKPKENSKIVFDLDADLTSLFNWNTKQVFVYLTAEYDGKKPDSSNKVTYWDKIIRSKEEAEFHLKNQRAKYSVWDVERSFRGRNATLKLEWNVQPWVGALLYGATEPETTMAFAERKTKKEQTP